MPMWGSSPADVVYRSRRDFRRDGDWYKYYWGMVCSMAKFWRRPDAQKRAPEDATGHHAHYRWSQRWFSNHEQGARLWAQKL
jgi:hypothetical protein